MYDYYIVFEFHFKCKNKTSQYLCMDFIEFRFSCKYKNNYMANNLFKYDSHCNLRGQATLVVTHVSKDLLACM